MGTDVARQAPYTTVVGCEVGTDVASTLHHCEVGTDVASTLHHCEVGTECMKQQQHNKAGLALPPGECMR